MLRRLFLTLTLCLGPLAGTAFAQSTEPAAEEPGTEPPVTVDLNKLEPVDTACRAYLVVENGAEQEFTTFTLDLYVFDPEGTISKRLAVDIAPLIPGKTRVRPFDIRETSCGQVSKILLNDVLACADTAGEREDCVSLVTLTSHSGTEFIE